MLVLGAVGLAARLEPESAVRAWGGYELGRSIDERLSTASARSVSSSDASTEA